MTPEDFLTRLELSNHGRCSDEVKAAFEQLSREWESGDVTALDRLIQLLATFDA